MTKDNVSRGAKRLWKADRARLTRADEERKSMRAIVSVAMICFVSACTIHHKWEVTLAPKVLVTPINLGSGAKVSLMVLDERPTTLLADHESGGVRFRVSAPGDLSLAVGEQLRSGLVSLGFEVLPTSEPSTATLEIHLLSLALDPELVARGSNIASTDVVAKAKADVRRGQTHLFQKTYNAAGTSAPIFARRTFFEEKANAALSGLISKMLADIELLAALK